MSFSHRIVNCLAVTLTDGLTRRFVLEEHKDMNGRLSTEQLI